jgi:hypothetical protein
VLVLRGKACGCEGEEEQKEEADLVLWKDWEAVDKVDIDGGTYFFTEDEEDKEEEDDCAESPKL